ncbi:AAA family ATPase [Candidatus Thiosymbion oneisti]|uniref:AAA family ATPase n=1 Tax=Candidatus Thiosymbion oneisti TaxID=589554 RepID=UPI00105DEF1E|nr:MoxR family ATPase [Candidatus Thiosymbion oneisti]
MSELRFYTGRGHAEPKAADRLPTVDPAALRAPQGYRATDRTAAAVEVALTLGMPLLVTGEPGSGKSGLAASIAWELGLGEVLRFAVKSDTESRDLFYRFDTVGRFHAANTLKEGDPGTDPGRFITFEPLGRAILLAKPERVVRELGVPDYAVAHPGRQRRSVVLIDEIDKAPRDVPNDILVEIEHMQFDIPELSGAGRPTVHVGLEPEENRYRPIVVFTSNSEKALPDPFLRRCVYLHQQFPPFEAELEGKLSEDQVTVESIVSARLGARYQGQDQTSRRIQDAVGFFRFLREQAGLERRPTLAELLDWLDYLMPQRTPILEWHALAALTQREGVGEARLRAGIESLLLKSPADQARTDTLLTDWRGGR